MYPAAMNSLINPLPTETAMSLSDSQKSRLLIVDDDALFLDSMHTVLSTSYDIQGCHNGPEALEQMALQKYDLVILDYNMRPMNGIEVLRAMRKMNIDCPVIILTGYGTFEMAAEAVDLNVGSILTKPIRMEQLLSTIQKCLDQNLFREKIRQFNRQLNEWEVHRHIIEAQKDELEKMKSLINLTYKEIHTLFGAVQDPILVMDTHLKIVDANPAVAEIMQTPLQELRGKDYSEFCLRSGLSNGEEWPARKVLATGKPYEYIFNEPAKGISFDIQAYPIFNDTNDQMVNVVEFRRRINADTTIPPRPHSPSQAITRLPLTREMGHEINNMLTIIRATADIMGVSLHKGNMDKAKDTLHKMNEGIDRLVRYTKNLMAKRQEENPPRKISILSVIQSLIDFLSTQPLFSRIEFQINSDPSIPNILGREEQIQEIFMNLFKNAAEAMGEGHLQVDVHYDVSHERVQITVTDNGPGIPVSMQRKLFNEPMTTKVHGNGYGLMIAKQLAEQNGGTIEIQPYPERGTRFVLMFPRVKEEVPRET